MLETALEAFGRHLAAQGFAMTALLTVLRDIGRSGQAAGEGPEGGIGQPKSVGHLWLGVPGDPAGTGRAPLPPHARPRRRLASATTWEARLACPTWHPSCGVQGAARRHRTLRQPRSGGFTLTPDGGRG